MSQECPKCEGVKRGPEPTNTITMRKHSYPKRPWTFKVAGTTIRRRAERIYRFKTVEKGVAYQCRSCGCVMAAGKVYASLEEYRKKREAA